MAGEAVDQVRSDQKSGVVHAGDPCWFRTEHAATRRRYMDPTTVTTNRSKAGSSLCRGSSMRAGPKLPDAGSNCAVRRRRDTAPNSPRVPTVEFRIHPLSLLPHEGGEEAMRDHVRGSRFEQG
jgi:hypothetical protein